MIARPETIQKAIAVLEAAKFPKATYRDVGGDLESAQKNWTTQKRRHLKTLRSLLEVEDEWQG
jgi:hypothetical protein